MPKLRVIIKPPPEPQGDAEQQTEALRDYLLQMSEELAYVLTHLEADNINDSTFERIQSMIPRPYTGLPVMDGEANAGQSEQWARGDHRHGHDSTKADVTALATETAARGAHEADTGNPHSVTAAQVGLGNVANERQYSAQNPPPIPTPGEVGAIPTTEKGSAGGVAELDSNGMVPSAQLPSYVDDVLEYASLSAFPVTGESGKIYVALDTNRTYRWSGSAYVEISKSLALGETSSTAYRGDRGKIAYDHSQVTSGNPHNVTAAEVGLGNVANERQYSAQNPPPLPTPADIGAAAAQDLTDHEGDTNNPHSVTAAQVGARPDTWMPTAADVGAQPTITASGMLKGDGLGGVSAATAGTDYQAPLTAGVDYQTPLSAGTDYQTPLVAGTDYATPAQIPTVPDPSDAAPQDLGTAAAGSSDDYSRADHVHNLPDADDIGYDNTGSGLSASDVQAALDELAAGGGGGGPSPATATPVMDGTGAVGTSLLYAREDHEHPSDTAKQDAITANGVLKGDGAGGVSAATPGTDYQAPLTFDAAPTASSTNPVQSGGVYTDVRTRVPVNGMGKNLLRNWYFVGGGTGRGVFPVNQRGFTTSSNVNHVWSVDGWYINGGIGTQTLNSTGFYLTHTGTSGSLTLQQWIGNDAEYTGKTMTLSTIVDGVLVSKTAIIPQKTSATQYAINVPIASGVDVNLFAFPISTPGYLVQFQATAGTSMTVQAVKLEFGTEQTLAHQENGVWVLNELPDYEEELIKCKTYPGYTGTIPDTYDNKSLATQQDLTSIQATGTTNTTGAAIPAGTYFYLNGILYRAKTQIDVNATFTVNTNCEQVTVGGALVPAVVGGTVNTTNTSGYVIISSIGRLCTVYFAFTTSAVIGTADVLATIPATYKPSARRSPVQYLYKDPNATAPTIRTDRAGMYLNTDGTLTQGLSNALPSGYILQGIFTYTI